MDPAHRDAVDAITANPAHAPGGSEDCQLGWIFREYAKAMRHEAETCRREAACRKREDACQRREDALSRRQPSNLHRARWSDDAE